MTQTVDANAITSNTTDLRGEVDPADDDASLSADNIARNRANLTNIGAQISFMKEQITGLQRTRATL